MANPELSALIDAHLPDDLLKRALRAVFQAKKVAYDHCAAEFLSSARRRERPAVLCPRQDPGTLARNRGSCSRR